MGEECCDRGTTVNTVRISATGMHTGRRYGVGPVSDGALFFTAKKSAQKKAAPQAPGRLAHP
jgi:hypothetical protein